MMARLIETFTCNKCHIINLIISVSNFYHFTVAVLTTGGRRVWFFVHLFVDGALEGLHEAVGVRVVVYGALLSRVPAESHQVVMAITSVQQCSCVSLRKIKHNTTY